MLFCQSLCPKKPRLIDYLRRYIFQIYNRRQGIEGFPVCVQTVVYPGCHEKSGSGDRRLGSSFLDLIERSERIRCIWADRRLEAVARDILRRYDDQDFSYVDAVSFATMQHEGLTDAFAFDRHFYTMGFSIFPS